MPINPKLFCPRSAFVISFIVGGLLIGGARPEMANLLEKPYDKLAHAVAYSLITLLIWFSCSGSNKNLVAVLVSAFIALSDEFYQLFLPGREADPVDFLTDISAIGFTGLMLYHLQSLRR